MEPAGNTNTDLLVLNLLRIVMPNIVYISMLCLLICIFCLVLIFTKYLSLKY